MMSGEDGKKIVDEKTIAREIFGEPSAHGDIDAYGEGRTDNYSYAQPASTYEERKKQFWELDKEKVLLGLGIYFLASLPILFVLPSILVYFHLISKAMVGLISALWIELYLANTVGASGYLLEVRNCWDMYYCDGDLVDKAELIFALYLLLCIAFFIIEPFIFGSI